MARRPEQRKRAKPSCKFHLFNCDGTCRLEPVESLLRAVEKKVDFKITIKKHSQNTAQLLKIIPELKMDYAVFVVHARDSSRSFNDDSNGKIYNALKKRTGSDEKVLIVIGEDERYKDKDEEEKAVISHLGKNEISVQIRRELVDGRKSFVFSWNKEHRPIHEEAMLHFLDPSKNGQEFIPNAKTQMENVPVAEPKTQPVAKKDENPIDAHASNTQPVAKKDENPTAAHASNTQSVAKKDENPKDAHASNTQPVAKKDENPTAAHASNTQPVAKKDENPTAALEPNPSIDEPNANPSQAFTEGSRTDYRSGTVLLSTVVRFGVISYKTKDVKIWKDDKKWRVSPDEARKLAGKWKSVPTARLTLFTDDEGVVKMSMKDETGIVERLWNCSIS